MSTLERKTISARRENLLGDAPGAFARARFVRITAKWYVRGGIYTNVVAEHRKKGWKPEPVVQLPRHDAETGLL